MARPGKKAPKKVKTLTKGHVTTKVEKPQKQSYHKGRLTRRTELVRSVIREISGFAPYERKIIELLQAGGARDEKKALKLAKRRLGTHSRGVKKREGMRLVMQKMRGR